MSRRVTQSGRPGNRPAGWLSVEEVAEAIHRHPEVVRRQAREGRLPGEKIGRGWFFRASRLVQAGYAQFGTSVEASPADTEALLVALSDAGQEALHLTDQQAIFQAIGRRLAEVGASSFFFILQPDGRHLRIAHWQPGPAATRGEITEQHLGREIPLDSVPNLRRACETRRAQFLGDPELLVQRTAANYDSDGLRRARRISQMLGMRAAISAPLVTRDRVLGAITVIGPGLREADLPAVSAFANQTAAALEASRLVLESRESEEAVVQTLAMAIEMRDAVHSRAADHARLAERLAADLGLDATARRRVRYAALLQDLGKIGMPDAVLRKQRRLDSEERAVLMTHPVLAAEMLRRFPPLADLAPLVRAHHEWFNGEGYPDGLKADAIPLETRIVSVINSLFSVTFDLPTRSPDVLAGALQELRHFAGVGLDPTIVEALLAMLDRASRERADWYLELQARISEPAQLAGQFSHGPRDMLSVTDSRELRIIYRVAQEMNAVLDLDVLLKRIVTIVREVMDYYLVSLLLPSDQSPGDLRVGAHSGYAIDIAGMTIPAGQGVTGWVFANGTPQIVPDVGKEPTYVGLDPNVRSELAFPLISRGRVVGVLNAESAHLNAFSEADIALMSAVGSQLASCLDVAQMHDTIKREATHDPLTRLYNRRVFLDRLQQEVARAGRSGEPFSVVFLDVNGLKVVNDTYGHLPGDALLREVANALTDAVRGEDTVARFGGDEFVLLLPATPGQAATIVAHRIRDGIARHRFMAAGQLLSIPGVSIGMAAFPENGRTADELLAAADAALYAQKRRPAS